MGVWAAYSREEGAFIYYSMFIIDMYDNACGKPVSGVVFRGENSEPPVRPRMLFYL